MWELFCVWSDDGKTPPANIKTLQFNGSGQKGAQFAISNKDMVVIKYAGGHICGIFSMDLRLTFCISSLKL